MSRPRPILQDMPRLVKENIVQQMDFLSRFSLRRCSKAYQKVIDSFPIILNEISLQKTGASESQNDSVILTVTFGFVKRKIDFRSDPIGCRILIRNRRNNVIKGANYLHGAMLTLLSFLKHPETIVKKFTIDHTGAPENLEAFLGLLTSFLSTLNHHISIVNLQFYMNMKVQKDSLTLLSFLKPGVLQEMRVYGRNFLTLNDFKRVVEIAMGSINGPFAFQMCPHRVDPDIFGYCEQFPGHLPGLPRFGQKRIEIPNTNHFLDLTIDREGFFAIDKR